MDARLRAMQKGLHGQVYEVSLGKKTLKSGNVFKILRLSQLGIPVTIPENRVGQASYVGSAHTLTDAPLHPLACTSSALPAGALLGRRHMWEKVDTS